MLRRPLNTLLLIAASAISTGAWGLQRCEVDGRPVNPANGAETAGLTGLMRCRDADSGQLQREQELRNGRFVGLERFFDREGRLLRERTVNERGNSHGRVAEFWPSGQLKREETADNGRAQGAVRRFSEQGRLERLAFHAEGREQFVLEYNAVGQPQRLQCSATSLFDEDRQPCGFASGATDTVLYSARGTKAAQVRYDRGRLLSSTVWDADGVVTAEQLREQGRRVHRSYSNEAGRSVLREERIFDADDLALPDRRGPLASLRRWGASGQLTEQRGFAGGREVALERWYLNGAPRERSTVRGEGDQVRIAQELYGDDGRLAERRQLTRDQQPTGPQQAFHPRGRVAREDTYGPPDARGRTRLLSRKEWDEAGQPTADDTFLEDGSRQRKAGGLAS